MRSGKILFLSLVSHMPNKSVKKEGAMGWSCHTMSIGDWFSHSIYISIWPRQFLFFFLAKIALGTLTGNLVNGRKIEHRVDNMIFVEEEKIDDHNWFLSCYTMLYNSNIELWNCKILFFLIEMKIIEINWLVFYVFISKANHVKRSYKYKNDWLFKRKMSKSIMD